MMADDSNTQPPNLAGDLRQGSQRELEQIVRAELEIERLSEEEASLLGAYLKEDARAVSGFWHELKDEVELLENRTADWVLGAADQTRLEWLRLDLCTHKPSQLLMAGETVCDEPLQCLACQQKYQARGTLTLSACGKCGCEYFKRNSGEEKH